MHHCAWYSVGTVPGSSAAGVRLASPCLRQLSDFRLGAALQPSLRPRRQQAPPRRARCWAAQRCRAIFVASRRSTTRWGRRSRSHSPTGLEQLGLSAPAPLTPHSPNRPSHQATCSARGRSTPASRRSSGSSLSGRSCSVRCRSWSSWRPTRRATAAAAAAAAAARRAKRR